MARFAALEPSKVSGRLRPWCVNVPAELSSTGKRRQLFFATKKDALIECKTLKARRDNFGVSLAAMTPARIAKAAEAYKLLDPHNIDLLDATRGYLATHKQRSASIPFGQLFKLFLEAKEKRSRAYRNHLQWLRKRTESIHHRLASDITVRDLDALLEGEKPTVKNAWMRYLRAVFNWGLKRDYLASNPIGKMDFEDVIKGDTQIFEAKDVQAILNDCLENDFSLLPYRVFGFFCGVRPDGELPRLVWSDLEWHDKVLRLRAEITKKKRLRFVEVGRKRHRMAPRISTQRWKDGWARRAVYEARFKSASSRKLGARSRCDKRRQTKTSLDSARHAPFVLLLLAREIRRH